ncbi:MAG: hypothetical protein NT061_10490 [Spirochaetes bacterium]|nr:hypothetical protein [Spirochaetota bacterium]
MNSEELYRSIDERDRAKIAANDVAIDALAMNPRSDGRLGISLILPVRLDGETYERLVHRLAGIEPGQYYYPEADLHTTIFDFLSARRLSWPWLAKPVRQPEHSRSATGGSSAGGLLV